MSGGTKFTDEQIERAVDVGLTAAYKKKSGGYLGQNIEERTKAGIRAAIEFLLEDAR